MAFETCFYCGDLLRGFEDQCNGFCNPCIKEELAKEEEAYAKKHGLFEAMDLDQPSFPEVKP